MPIIGELYTMTINYGFMSNTTTYLLEKAVKSCEVLVSVVSQPNESDDRKQTPGPEGRYGSTDGRSTMSQSPTTSATVASR